MDGIVKELVIKPSSLPHSSSTTSTLDHSIDQDNDHNNSTNIPIASAAAATTPIQDANAVPNHQISTRYDRRQLALEVNGVNYVFEYNALPAPSMDIIKVAEQLATDFCRDNGVGLLKEYFEKQKLTDKREIVKALRTGCFIPLRGAIVDKIREQYSSSSSSSRETATNTTKLSQDSQTSPIAA